MSNEYIRKEDAVGAVEFGITLASAINIETGEWTELFQRENDELREAVERIKDIEPADVSPVRRGMWKKIGKWGRVYRCDQCGNFLDFDGVNAGRGDTNFCPNCGAKMDGKRKE